MSFSAMPSALIPSMTACIDRPAASRASRTVDLVTLTPTLTCATSGTRETDAVPVVVRVCAAGSPSVVGAPTTGPGRIASAANATTSAPSAIAPAVRMGCDMGYPFVSCPGGHRWPQPWTRRRTDTPNGCTPVAWWRSARQRDDLGPHLDRRPFADRARDLGH